MFTKLELSLINESLLSSIHNSKRIMKDPESYINQTITSKADAETKNNLRNLLQESLNEQINLQSKVIKLWRETE